MPLVRDHGKLIHAAEGGPPGVREIVLSGQFSIVKYMDEDTGMADVYMVLMGRKPTNRKLVYRIIGDTLVEVQDMPGGARGV